MNRSLKMVDCLEKQKKRPPSFDTHFKGHLMVVVSRPRRSSTDSWWNYYGVSVCALENGPRFEASAVLLCPARQSRLPSPWPLLCSSSVPVFLPSLLAQLSAPSSAASVLLKLHVPLQLSLLPLGFLLCRLVCIGKKSSLEDGDPGERPAEATPQGFSRAGPTHSVLARPL